MKKHLLHTCHCFIIVVVTAAYASCNKEPATPIASGTTQFFPPPPPPSPSVSNCSFWLKDPYGFGDNYIEVPTGILNLTISGETKTLYFYYNESGPTACGLIGTLNFNLPVGIHQWNATYLNGSRSVSGAILVTASGCSVKEIIF